MNKVTTVSLNGRAYQIEEDGHRLLAGYLDGARASLGQDPDADEVISDLESAIADKCESQLTLHKNVVSTREISEILNQMGPVEVEENNQSKNPRKGASNKRLYAVRQGAIISGVCNGIGAYLGLDVTIVRIVAIFLAFLTQGLAIIGYFIMAIVLPVAKTPEQEAEAKGEAFNASRIVDDVKARYENFAADKATKEKLNNLGGRVGHYTKKSAGFIPVIFGSIILALLALSLVVLLVAVTQSGDLLGYKLGNVSIYTYYLLVVASFVLAFWPVQQFTHNMMTNVLGDRSVSTHRNRLAPFIGWLIWVLALALLIGVLVANNFNFSNVTGGTLPSHLSCAHLPYDCQP